jgi:hypothetical protein
MHEAENSMAIPALGSRKNGPAHREARMSDTTVSSVVLATGTRLMLCHRTILWLR